MILQADNQAYWITSLGPAEDHDGDDVADQAEHAHDPHEDAIHYELERITVGPSAAPGLRHVTVAEVIHEGH